MTQVGLLSDLVERGSIYGQNFSGDGHDKGSHMGDEEFREVQ